MQLSLIASPIAICRVEIRKSYLLFDTQRDKISNIEFQSHLSPLRESGNFRLKQDPRDPMNIPRLCNTSNAKYECANFRLDSNTVRDRASIVVMKISNV